MHSTQPPAGLSYYLLALREQVSGHAVVCRLTGLVPNVPDALNKGRLLQDLGDRGCSGTLNDVERGGSGGVITCVVTNNGHGKSPVYVGTPYVR